MWERAQDGGAAVSSRAEQVSDAAVHAVGLAAALLAVPLLVTLAVRWHGDAETVLTALIYGATLIAMLVCSALYNITYGSAWTNVFRRLDHTAIYLKIAGTYTPFAVLTGTHGGYLLTGLWGAAAVGSALKILAPERFRFFTIALCLGMGWAGMLLAEELIAGLATETFSLMLAGGLFYTAGVLFYLWDGLPFQTTIWHVFVLAGTALFYAAVVVQLGQPVADAAPEISLLQAAPFAG